MNIIFPYWQELRKLLVDRGDGTHAERVEAYPPKVLMTDNDGAFSRLRVDVAQTGFFAGREFRVYKEMTLAAGASACIRATVPINIILFDTSVHTDNSSIRVGLYSGGTAAGPWTPVPVFRKNTMTTAPVVANQVTVDFDGAHSGGTELDVIRVSTSGQSQTSTSIGQSQGSERGIAPGTYYYNFQNTGNASASVIFRAYWEERP